MRNIVISIAAVAALSAISAPAAAQQQQRTASPSQAQSESGTENRRDTGSDRVICMRVELSNSRIARRICRTEQEWRARGELD